MTTTTASKKKKMMTPRKTNKSAVASIRKNLQQPKQQQDDDVPPCCALLDCVSFQSGTLVGRRRSSTHRPTSNTRRNRQDPTPLHRTNADEPSSRSQEPPCVQHVHAVFPQLRVLVLLVSSRFVPNIIIIFKFAP